MADWYLVERNDMNTGKQTFQVFEEGNSIRMTAGDRIFTLASGGAGSEPECEELVVETVAAKAARTESDHVLKDATGNPVGKVRVVKEG